MGETKYQDTGRAQAMMLLDEVERHTRFLVSRIEQSGRRSRDITGEIAELREAYDTAAALRSHYELHRSPRHALGTGRHDTRGV
ncbi:hypothetical protein [Gordonia terrae]|uniref:hypothetical protein n=1 Tax=Gordonia terrae TaxID=2055 RepID=UPI003F6B8552